MTFTIRPAVREQTSVLLGLSGPTGGGKTFSAFSVAKGLSGGKRFCVIDTEAGRALHYAEQFDFDHLDFRPPFTPERYIEAIEAASGYPVIVIDSMSHEWAGEGGVLDMREALWAKDNYAGGKSVQSWIKPKGAHKRMMQKLVQQRVHLVFCLRAEEKMLVGKGGKITPAADRPLTERWEPICEKNFMFEMTASVLVLPSKPGVAVPVKVQEQHRAMLDTGRPLDEEAGRQLAEWASGGAKVADIVLTAEEWASKGPAAFQDWWKGTSQDERAALHNDFDRLIELAKANGEAA